MSDKQALRIIAAILATAALMILLVSVAIHAATTPDTLTQIACSIGNQSDCTAIWLNGLSLESMIAGAVMLVGSGVTAIVSLA